MNGQSQTATNYVREALALFEEYGAAEAIISGDRRMSYSDLRTGVLTMAAALQEQGIQPGSTVAVLVQNPPEGILLQLALHLLGCRSAWIAKAPRYLQAEFLRRAKADALIYAVSTHSEAGVDLASQVSSGSVLCLGPGGVGADLMAATPAALPLVSTELIPEPESLFQTSGTTGHPKLVWHGHRLFRSFLALAREWRDAGRPWLRHLSTQGFWHVSGQMAAFMALFTGGTLILQDQFNAVEMITTIERERITSIIVAPPGLYALLDHPLLEQANLSSLLQVTCGGSVASPARLTEAIARLGPIVRLVYAMSEAPQITELPDLDHDPAHPERLRSCGKGYGGMHIQVRDGSAAILPPGVPGDIWISGPLVMTGYWEDPETTHAALVAGWLRTGDYGYLDEAGFLYLLGRASDVIITGIASTNVYPGPIEDALVAHRGVRAAAVIGVPDESMGEAVVAFVVPSGEATATAAELIAAVTATLSTVWAPREIEFVDSLPVIGFGKVDKKVLRDRYVARRTSA